MCPLGRYVFLRKDDLSPGIQRLLDLIVSGERLNNYAPDELRFLHLILCRTFDFCLNVLLLREAQVNTACRDDALLSRKVPADFWATLYCTLVATGVHPRQLTKEESRAALAMRLNASPDLLQAITSSILRKYNLRACVKISPNNLTDGNYIFNLGAIIPSRCLMSLAACLRFWGDQCLEPWVRLFSGKFFFLYLLIGGFIGIRKTLLLDASERSYLGIFETLIEDLAAIRGQARKVPVIDELVNCQCHQSGIGDDHKDESLRVSRQCYKVNEFIGYLWMFNNGFTLGPRAHPYNIPVNRTGPRGWGECQSE